MTQKHFGSTLSQWADVDYIYPGQNYPDKGASVLDTDKAIDHFQKAGVNGMVQANPLSFTAVQYQTNNNGPIVVQWWPYGGSVGHLVVARGYDTASPGYVYYCDPADGFGHKVTYSSFKDNGARYWASSIFYK